MCVRVCVCDRDCKLVLKTVSLLILHKQSAFFPPLQCCKIIKYVGFLLVHLRLWIDCGSWRLYPKLQLMNRSAT